MNIQKYKAVSYGRNVNKDYKYHMLQEGMKMIVQRDDHIKDLGVTFDEKLDFGLHAEPALASMRPMRPHRAAKFRGPPNS